MYSLKNTNIRKGKVNETQNFNTQKYLCCFLKNTASQTELHSVPKAKASSKTSIRVSFCLPKKNVLLPCGIPAFYLFPWS